MPFVPETTTDDHFYYIIRIPQYYYSKFFKLCANVHILSSIYFLSMVTYNLLHNSENVHEEDIFFVSTIFEALVSKVSLDNLQDKLMEFNADTRLKLWSNTNLQIDFTKEETFFNVVLFLHVFTLSVSIVLIAAIPMTLSNCVYNENWILWFKVIYKTGSFFYILHCFYITSANLCYCVYTTLHYRFQMKILIKYIKRETGNYKHMKLLHKFYSDLYQEEVRQILLRSIKHYQLIKTSTQNVTSILSVTVLLHFVAGAIIISVGIHTVAFNTTKNAAIIIAIVVHAVLAALLYTELGHLVIEASSEFYTTLTNLEWYTFKKYNRRLYYMFICYSQQYSAVTVLTNTTTDRALLMQFLRTVYSTITVLKSVKK